MANNGKLYETMWHRTKVGANFTERNEFKVRLFLRIMCWLSRNSGSHNLLEPQGPVQACNGIAFFSPDTINSFQGRSETVASNRRFVHTPDHRWTNMQDWRNDNWQGENRIAQRWTGPCPPKIAYRLPWELNRPSALRRRWVTAWAKTRPSKTRCSSVIKFTF